MLKIGVFVWLTVNCIFRTLYSWLARLKKNDTSKSMKQEKSNMLQDYAIVH